MVITVLKVQNTSLNHTLHFQIWLLLARQAEKISFGTSNSNPFLI